MLSEMILQLLLGALAVAHHIVVEVGQPGTLLLNVGNATVEIIVKEPKIDPGLGFFDGFMLSFGIGSIIVSFLIVISAPFRQQVWNFFAKRSYYTDLLANAAPAQCERPLPPVPKRKNAYVDTTHFTLGTDKFMIMKTPSDKSDKQSSTDEDEVYDYLDHNFVGRSSV